VKLSYSSMFVSISLEYNRDTNVSVSAYRSGTLRIFGELVQKLRRKSVWTPKNAECPGDAPANVVMTK
jgi:hypothetical protein